LGGGLITSPVLKGHEEKRSIKNGDGPKKATVREEKGKETHLGTGLRWLRGKSPMQGNPPEMIHLLVKTLLYRGKKSRNNNVGKGKKVSRWKVTRKKKKSLYEILGRGSARLLLFTVNSRSASGARCVQGKFCREATWLKQERRKKSNRGCE